MCSRFSSVLDSRLSTQITRYPFSSRYSQRWEPRKPAPPVTTAVGTSGMLSASPAGSRLSREPYEVLTACSRPGPNGPAVNLCALPRGVDDDVAALEEDRSVVRRRAVHRPDLAVEHAVLVPDLEREAVGVDARALSAVDHGRVEGGRAVAVEH